jgi:superfamily I DNA and/or RNA helicase
VTKKQLPPQRDFESGFSDENDDDAVVEESILDLALTVFHPARELLFHYRSRHEDLIKFSNAKFYQNLLIPATSSIKAKDRGIKTYLFR